MGELDDNLGNLTTKALYDYNLVTKALDGDQRAYAELLERYRESVFFMMLKMVNNKDDAEDLTIEAFGRAFKKLHQYTPTFAFSTWLFKIASNNAIDFIRKKKQQGNSISLDYRPEDSDYDASNLIRTYVPNPEEFYIKKQKVMMVRAVIDKLKPKYKEIVELFYFQELSHEEISQKLDLPIGTIKAQLFRARDFLAELIKKTEHGKK
ncbi:MAG: RNA polymerase sigma factor [Bacteroidia bacterium]